MLKETAAVELKPSEGASALCHLEDFLYSYRQSPQRKKMWSLGICSGVFHSDKRRPDSLWTIKRRRKTSENVGSQVNSITSRLFMFIFFIRWLKPRWRETASARSRGAGTQNRSPAIGGPISARLDPVTDWLLDSTTNATFRIKMIFLVFVYLYYLTFDCWLLVNEGFI